MVNFADLVLPDTTYLERFDTISLLDRPISEPDAAADAIRHPLVQTERDVKPWQEVLVELASRLKFPAFTKPDGTRKFTGYKDFIVNYERSPGIGFLAGWRGKDGDKSLKGEPNPNQWEKYIENQSFFAHHWPDSQKYMRFANKEYLEVAADVGFVGKAEPIVMQIYSEPLQKFRLAGQGLYDGPQPHNQTDRERLAKYFDPLPMWYEPLESQRTDKEEYPFHAITQRPMFMYHSWDSQNVWLRQIQAQNFMFMNAGQAERLGLKDFDWIWVESLNGKIRCQMKTMEGCQEDTIWTWNAIGKQGGAWGLKPDASEAKKGFLLNHLISELLPPKHGERRLTNSDPVTGQAAWFDLRVKLWKAAPGEEGSWPEFPALKPLPWDSGERPDILRYDAKTDRK
jgi:anaerobic selenocysteine-containing dehydrogenase